MSSSVPWSWGEGGDEVAVAAFISSQRNEHGVPHAVTCHAPEQTTTQWQTKYARRAGVESTIAQATKTTDTRRARYRGLAKTTLDHNIKAAALNPIRLDTWWNGEALNPRRTSHLSRLELTLAA